MKSKPIIEVKNLSYEYEKNVDVLKDVSFSIEKGEYVTLIGHNGSGKSTLAKLLCYLLEPMSGEVLLNGVKETEKTVGDIRKTVGIVFQNPDNQFIGATVEDDIAFGLENRDVEVSKIRKLVNEYAAKVHMEAYLKKEPSEISGGQKQRVAIAGILALGLKIIIFDEATSMLDPEGVEDIKKIIFEMRKEDKELTFISITHDIEEAYNSDRVIILNKGQVYKDGKPEDVFKDAKSIYGIGLDLPFVLKVKNALNDENYKILEEINSIDSLARFICKSK
ncbi:MAG: energy-coupling factor transporter ATPase [Bacilli bacterium]|jgi:energy-coupling factor transport system ATP-binding protein